jgi:hypothetical protein
MSAPVKTIKTSEVVSRNIRDYYASKVHEAINGYALTNAIFAFTTSPLWDDLKRDGSIDAKESAARHNLVEDQVVGLLRYLTSQDVFKERERFYQTPFGDAVLSGPAVGRVHMYRGGYGNLYSNASGLMNGSMKYGTEPATRDGGYVASGTNSSTSAFYDEVPLGVLANLGVRTLVDFGCGAGAFLTSYVQLHPENRGIGVDLDANAIKEAKAVPRPTEVGSRIRFVLGDAFKPKALPAECEEAEVFYAFGMVHEILRGGDGAFLEFVESLAERFPGRRFLLGEPLVNRTPADGAFYWLHVLSKQGIPLNLVGWTALIGRLKNAHLEAVYRPDHEMVAAYFSIVLKPKQ